MRLTGRSGIGQLQKWGGFNVSQGQAHAMQIALAMVIALAIIEAFCILILVLLLRKVDEIAKAVCVANTTLAPRNLEQRFRAAMGAPAAGARAP